MQLVVTEKPSVAQAISHVIGAKERKDGYMEGNGFLVSWCVGHLVELAQPEMYSEAWKKWSYESLPMIPEQWQHEVKKETATQYKILKNLMHDTRVESVVCATDAGREGELIFRLVYEQAGCRKPMKRLWISSMEESAIRDGFENLKPGSDYDSLYQSALCRQQADWLVGLNGTRLFTVLYGGKVLKVGRVQTPTLAMLVDREVKIMNFEKEQYYMAHILMDGIDAMTERIDDKARAESIAAACESQSGVVRSVIKENKSVAPPKLYDLTTLQRDANRIFGFTAKQTLEYTQSLYEKKLVTYPRTDARVLSTAVAKEIHKNIHGLSGFANVQSYAAEVLEGTAWKKIASTRYVNDKQITDHYAIIPTGQGLLALRSVSALSVKVYELIARRFLSIFYPPAIYQKTTLVSKVQQESFFSSFRLLLSEGYLKVAGMPEENKKKDDTEDVKCDENLLQALQKCKKGDILPVKGFSIKEGETSPPKRYTSGSMILAMENAGQLIEDEELRAQIKSCGIGTSATRAEILKKLVANKYIALNKKTQIITPTLLGEMIYDVVFASIHALLNPELTASWELGLTMVADGKITEEEYMMKLNSFITNHVQNVKSKNYQNLFKPYFDKAAANYKTSKKTAKKTTAKSGTDNSKTKNKQA